MFLLSAGAGLILGSATASASLPYMYTPIPSLLPSVTPQVATSPGTVTAYFTINGVQGSALAPNYIQSAVAASAISALRDAIASASGGATPDASLFSTLVGYMVTPPRIVVRWTVCPAIK